MRTAVGLALAAALMLGSAGCAGDQHSYGAKTAGPTIAPTMPAMSTAPAIPAPAATAEQAARRHRTTCLFRTPEIAGMLGLAVGPATRTEQGPFTVCTWKATNPPAVPSWRKGDPVTRWDDGLVTITTGNAGHYTELVNQVRSLARQQNATGRQDLSWVGNGAFAVGASVSGVPIWHAVAAHKGRVVAVEVTGADSKSSIATVSGFLLSVLDRS